MVLVTGNDGYIGAVLVRMLKEQGYAVTGLDTCFYKGSEFCPGYVTPDRQIVKDVRNVEAADLDGAEAVIHLAALSNDPLGAINPSLTDGINRAASVRLAEQAKIAGVERYIFSSSCSIYGVAEDDRALTETDSLNPVTAYAVAKAATEREVAALATESFHPFFMRNSTVYGISPRLRLDLVVNDLVARAMLTGRVSIMSDGSPWRPLIHIQDLCSAFIAALTAPEAAIHAQSVNIGVMNENYRIREIGELIEKAVPGTVLEILNQTGPDERTYRVDFSKAQEALPDFAPAWNLERGIREIADAYEKYQLTTDMLEGRDFVRLRWLKNLLDSGELDENLRWNR